MIPKIRSILIFGIAASAAVAVHAAETITYTYDALGRLVQATRSGSVNNGASATYAYDPANNRTNVTTTAPSGGMALKQSSPPKDERSQQSGAANGSPRN